MAAKLPLFFSLLFILSCAAKMETPKSAPPKDTLTEQRAKQSFEELDCSIEGNCPPAQTPVVSEKPIVSEKPKPTPKPVPESVAEKPRPGASVSAASIPGRTAKYPMKDGYPVWYSSPVYGGYIGGVGVALPQNGGYPVQRRVAITLAQADLARSVKVDVNNEFTSERTLIDTATQSAYREVYSSISRQSAEGLIANPVVKDEWLNPNTGDLFIWVVIER
jgi:hypothetical protein